MVCPYALKCNKQNNIFFEILSNNLKHLIFVLQDPSCEKVPSDMYAKQAVHQRNPIEVPAFKCIDGPFFTSIPRGK